MSVVVPLYNKGPYVGEAVDSVLRQTSGRFELFVVDDGSTDGSAAVVSAWQDPRLRILSQPNRGPGAERNRGIDAARGEWIAFLDADDFWHPRFLERALSFAEAHREIGAVFSNISTIPGGEDILLHMPRRDVVVPDYFQAALDNQGVGITSSTALVRRDLFARIGGFRQGVQRGEDVDMWARVAWSGPVGFVAGTQAVYRRDVPGSLTSRARSESPPDPPFLSSYARWAAAGSIPKGLEKSSRLLAQRVLVDHAAELINKGEIRRAVKWLISHSVVGGLPLVRSAGIAVRALLSPPVVEQLRDMFAVDCGRPVLGGHERPLPRDPFVTHSTGIHFTSGRVTEATPLS